jgi:hypothetical protein
LTGPVCDTTQELFLRLLLADEGVVIISTDTTSSEIQSEFERLGSSSDPNRVRFVNCVSSETEDENAIPTDDLSRIGIRYAKQYEDVYDRGVQSCPYRHLRTDALVHRQRRLSTRIPVYQHSCESGPGSRWARCLLA